MPPREYVKWTTFYGANGRRDDVPISLWARDVRMAARITFLTPDGVKTGVVERSPLVMPKTGEVFMYVIPDEYPDDGRRYSYKVHAGNIIGSETSAECRARYEKMDTTDAS